MKEIKHIIFFIKSILKNSKLEWDNSSMFSIMDNDSCFYIRYYKNFSIDKDNSLMNYSFVKLKNATKYNTKCYYIGDLFYNTEMERVRDLFSFCSKTFLTKDGCRIVKTPSVYKFLKVFYESK